MIKLGITVGVFIFLFLYSFRPFGLHLVGDNLLLFSGYFGAITFFIIVLYDIFLVHILRVKTNLPSWTLGKWLLSVFGLIFLISIGNLFVLLEINPGSRFSWIQFLGILRATFLIGIFPVLFFGSIKVSNSKRENENIAKGLHVNPNEEPNTIDKEYIININEDNLSFRAVDLLFVEAMQNYVTLYLLDEEKSVSKTTIRATLKSLVEKIDDPSILQSHRSYIVNSQHIKDITGNAQGLKLSMRYSDQVVPVSRKYIPIFKLKYV